MEVTIKTRSDKEIEECEYRDKIEIYINRELVFEAHDDEPEDSNLSRSFSDCYNIPVLLKRAFEEGKERGGDFILVEEEIND